MINIVEGHQFTSSVGYKPGPGRRQYDRITNAACECGVEYEWEGREAQHDRHVLEMIRADEREKVAARIREVEPVEWALAGQHAGDIAARIAEGAS